MNKNKIKLGDYVIIREITGLQKLIHIEDDSQVFYIGKYTIKGSDIIGKNYYNTLNLEEGNWKIGSILNSEEILKEILEYDNEDNFMEIYNQNHKYKRIKYNPLLECEKTDSSYLNEDDEFDNIHNIDEIKRIRNEILSNNKLIDNDLIKSLVLSSNTFKNKTKFSKEKYIKKLQLRYLKQLILLPPTLLNVIETSSCQFKIRTDKLSPNSVGPRWGQCTVRIETIGNIMTHGNICYDSEVIFYDNLSNGIVGGSIYRQLCEKGSLYEISLNQLTFDTIEGYFNGKLPINFEAIVQDPNPKLHYYNIPISALDIFSIEKKKNINNKDFEFLDIKHEWLNYKINNHLKNQLSLEKIDNKKTKVKNRINILNKLYCQGVNAVILIIDQVKWHSYSIHNIDNEILEENNFEIKLDNNIEIENNQDKYEKSEYFNMKKFVQITQEYLKPGGKLLIFTPFMTTELLQIHQDLVLSTKIQNSEYHPFTGIKLEETFIREQQIIDQRTHPVMDANLPIFSGFLLSAIHIL